MTDLDRAARFLCLRQLTFGGKVTGRTFGVIRTGSSFDITKLRWLLLINDVSEIRALFTGCWVQVVRTTYTIAKNADGAGVAGEALISVEEPPENEGTAVVIRGVLVWAGRFAA